MAKFSFLWGKGIFLLLGAGVLMFGGLTVFATNRDDIQYPVSELGGCENEESCKAYCEEPANRKGCLVFAAEHNLLSEEELLRAEKFVEIKDGPGGCTTEESCKAYCSEISHISECLAFAEKHDLMDEEELKEAKKVAKALQEGVQLPGGCTTKEQCEAYCEDPSNLSQCIAFAEKAGFLEGEELQEAKQIIKALEAGVKLPGGCKSKESCEAYCNDTANTEECFNFAVAAGFIHPDEVEEAKKVMPLMKAGKMPGGCKSKESCEAYCMKDENIEECVAFFTEAGFMTEEDAAMFRKTGGKGPGECKSKEECEAFCNNPDNQQACFDFAKEHGLISEEELGKMEEGVAGLKKVLEESPTEIKQCLESEVGTEILDKIRAGTLMPGPQIGDQVKNCFDKFPNQRGGEGQRQEGIERFQEQIREIKGPGGCAVPEECQNYCSDSSHSEECGNFKLPEGAGNENRFPGTQEDFQRIQEEEMRKRMEEETQRRIQEETRRRMEEEAERIRSSMPSEQERIGQPQVQE